MKFGSGKASVYTGLSPTFTIFSQDGISPVTPPGITETPSGSGIYSFQYGPTLPMAFEIDGTATITSTTDRYIYGMLDPLDQVDIGITTVASNLATLQAWVGTTVSSFGDDSTDPSDVFGYLKRVQENLEGNAVFTKSSGVWDVSSRGSSVLLFQKTLSDNSSEATKS